MIRLALLIALALALAAPARAHEIRPGYLEITGVAAPEAGFRFDIVWKAPVQAGRPLPVEPVFPPDCRRAATQTRDLDGAALLRRMELTCDAPLTGRSLALSGLDATFTDVLVRVADPSGRTQTYRATPDRPGVDIAESQTRLGLAGAYARLGAEHILLGYDHLLFVLALILLIENVRRLVETITAFTLAHSLTLIATSLGWVSLPPAPVEAVIALSVLFMAAELAQKGDGRPRLTERAPWLIAFAFGLLHGFGFAGALAEIGLPEGDIALALLSFNVGVEVGQLIFVAFVLAALAAVKRWRLRPAFERIASYGVGVTSSYWLIDRLL